MFENVDGRTDGRRTDDGRTDDGRRSHWYIIAHLGAFGSGELKIEKEAKMSISIFIFIYTIHLAYLKVYTKFENTGSNRSREICDRNFHWRERKMNK